MTPLRTPRELTRAIGQWTLWSYSPFAREIIDSPGIIAVQDEPVRLSDLGSGPG